MKLQKNNRILFEILNEYLEYLLLLFIILDCHSMFIHSQDNGNYSYYYTIRALVPCLVVILLFFRFRSSREHLTALKPFFSILSFYLLLSLLLFFGNVRRFVPSAAEDYILRYVISLPLMTLLFYIDHKDGEPYRLWQKHADLVYWFSIANGILYLIITFFPERVQSTPVATNWTGTASITIFRNFYNICILSLNSYREFLGLRLFRNFGVFPEPLFFCIPLITALFTELFLSRGRPVRTQRCIILSLVIFTTQSSLGFILLALAWLLKIILILPSRSRRFVIPVLALAFVGFCAFVLHQKAALFGSGGVSSFGVHVEDYKLGLKAFLEHPFFGGGYGDYSCIQRFMSAERLEKNSGLSNSIAVVLGMGGIVQGTMCTVPFLLLLLQFLKRKNRSLASWGIGVFSLYVVTIFLNLYFLIMIMAFGYSLVEISLDRGKIQLSILTEISDPEALPGSPYKRHKHIYTCVFLLTFCLIVILFSRPLLNALLFVLARGNHVLGQSVWKTVLLYSIILFLLVFLRWRLPIVSSWPGKCLTVTYSLAFFSVFLVLYPGIYSWINFISLCYWKGLENLETFAIFLFFMALFLLGYSLFTVRRGAKQWLFLCTAVFVTVFVVWQGARILSNRLQYESGLLSQEHNVIEDVLSAHTGNIYSNDRPLVYHASYPEIQLTATKDRGFSQGKNISILFPHDRNLKDLFNAGFQVAELSENLLLYSNDDSLIQGLSQKGYHFFHYYAFPVSVNLDLAASINGLPRTETGGLLLAGEEHALNGGPYGILDNGKYTATFSLHIDPIAIIDSDHICNLRISYNMGKVYVVTYAINKNQFDGRGHAEIELPFTVPDCRDVAYSVIPYADHSVEVNSIVVQETPEIITVSTCNGFDLPVTEVYYDLDGNPVARSLGNYQTRYTYDNLGRSIKIEYFDAVGSPVLIQYGYAAVQYKRNYQGYITRETYYDVDGAPIMIPSHYAILEKDYNKTGTLLISQRYLDTAGRPVESIDGYASFNREYNDLNQIICEEYYDEEGQLVLLPQGYAVIEKEYDANGNIAVQRYLDVDHHPILLSSGYAEIHRTFNEKKQVIREEYYDTDGKPVSSKAGYASLVNQYDKDGQLFLTWFYAEDGRKLESGSGFMHEYLQNLSNYSRAAIFISIKDEGTYSLTPALMEDFKALGIQADLIGKFRYSYYAVIGPERVTEELSEEMLIHEGAIEGTSYTISSAGFDAGNLSSIVINGTEYSKNVRGMNMVVWDLDEQRLIDSIGFDTYDRQMRASY